VCRAYHASISRIDVVPTHPYNAIGAFSTMLYNLWRNYAPDYLVCVFDDGRPAWRRKTLEPFSVYKGARKEKDESLVRQLKEARVLAHTFGIPIISGYEGDDVIATIAEHAKHMQADIDVRIFTSDHDMFQLVCDRVHVMCLTKGVTDAEEIDRDAVIKKCHGIDPERIVDWYGLKGDSSDNIPGVTRVGDVTAARLLAQYETFDNLYAHVDEVRGAVGKNLKRDEAQARASRKVATIMRDVPGVNVDLDAASKSLSMRDLSNTKAYLMQHDLATEASAIELSDPVLEGPAYVVSVSSSTKDDACGAGYAIDWIDAQGQRTLGWRLSHTDTNATDYRLQLEAAFEALRVCDVRYPVHVLCANETIVNALTHDWTRTWAAHGWMRDETTPVAEADVWRLLAGEASRHAIAWHLVDRDCHAVCVARRLAREARKA
jgi:5'-3' exonuclease/ribonuclease HI